MTALPINQATVQTGTLCYDSNILLVEKDTGRTAAEKGLIVVTSILSGVLVLVSSVLLYITGGWDALQEALTNCWFEEVEDDEHYLTHSKSTIHMHSSDDEDGRNEDEDDEYDSEEASDMQPSSASGMLGAMPAIQGLGIKSPETNPNSLYGSQYTPGHSGMSSVMTDTRGIRWAIPA